MIDFAELSKYFVLVVVVACLIVGYILKTSFESFPNKYIPTVLAFVGLVLNLAVSGLSIENAVYGALMGLASTGMHQAFTRFVEGLLKKNKVGGLRYEFCNYKPTDCMDLWIHSIHLGCCEDCKRVKKA